MCLHLSFQPDNLLVQHFHLLQHHIRISEVDVDGFRILHCDFLNNLPDEFIIKFRVPCRTFHQAVSHLLTLRHLLCHA